MIRWRAALIARTLRPWSSRRIWYSRAADDLDKDIQEFNQELEALFGSELNRENSKIRGLSEFISQMPERHSPKINEAANVLSHVDSSGKASMVNVSGKPNTVRAALASGRVELGPDVFKLVADNKVSKGDVLTVAKIAGIQAAKQTCMLIPLCHSIQLSSVKVDFRLDQESSSLLVTAEASSTGQTGVEMEALTAVSVACLTVYDMCKAASKSIKITSIQLESKSGGKSGDWQRV